jgi:hypothetical protein
MQHKHLSAHWIGLLLAISMLIGCSNATNPAPTNTSTPEPVIVSTSTALERFAEYLSQNPQIAQDLGASIGKPVWINQRLSQIYTNGMLILHSEGISREDRPSLASELLTHEPAPQHAHFSAPATAQALVPIDIQIFVTDYSGPAELWWYDAKHQHSQTIAVQIEQGQAQTQIKLGGALGPQSAALIIDGKLAGIGSTVTTLDAQTSLSTGIERFDILYPMIKGFMEQDITAYTLDGKAVRGYRSPDNNLLWLRDHTYQARGFRYFEQDMTSLIDAFRHAQYPDGSFPDFLERPEHQVESERIAVEADVEFLFVQAVYEAWQTTGDDEWLAQNLDAMRRAVAYSMSDPLRWDETYQLVKRPFTIDTWDFEYGPAATDPITGRPAPRHWIDENTIWGIFHGDNTGLAFALDLLAKIEKRVGDPMRGKQYEADADALIERLNALSWNGRFYTHFIPLEPFDVPGVDEAEQLSLSNTYALNRNILKRQQARAIIEEYYHRGQQRGNTFAEWYSIDPPFPAGAFGMGGRLGENPGEYVNGGIMPLVGGELARAAFRYGTEGYAFETLARYAELLQLTGESYLWYYPAGNPGKSSVDTLPTDGWGSSAMLGALFEGAAGINDHSSLYRDIVVSPRWTAAADVQQVHAVTRYAASDAYVAYTWQRNEKSISFEYTGNAEQVQIRLLLPSGVKRAASVTLNQQEQAHKIEDVYGSRYVEFDTTQASGIVQITWE